MKLVCSSWRCQWTGDESSALKATNPFIEGDQLMACPSCREQTIVECCDEPGCNQPATC